VPAVHAPPEPPWHGESISRRHPSSPSARAPRKAGPSPPPPRAAWATTAPLPPPPVRSRPRSRSSPANQTTSFPRPQCTSQGHALSKPALSSLETRAAAATAAGRRWSPTPAALCPNSHHPSTLGEHLVEPRIAAGSPGIGRSHAAPRPWTQLQGSSSFQGDLCKFQDLYVMKLSRFSC
jgi:hypothetical protein